MQDIYKLNWYNRNDKTYVFGLPVEVKNKFTSLIYNEKQVHEFFNDYSKLEKELVSIIKNRFGVNVNIKISDKSNTSYTDGKNIVIDSNKQISNIYDRLDVIFGLAFHELSHCLYTDFKYMKSKNAYHNALIQHISNILEDEEIEIRLVKNHASYGKFLGKVKYEVLEKTSLNKKRLQSKCVNNLDEIMRVLFCIIRYPKYIEYIDKRIMEKYESLFIKINNILINHKCPSAVPYVACNMLSESEYDKINITRSTLDATFEIYKYIQNYMSENDMNFDEEKTECEGNESSIISVMSDDTSGKSPNDINKMIDEEFGALMPHDDIYTGSECGADDVKTNNEIARFPNPQKYNALFNDVKQYVNQVKRVVIPKSIATQDVLETRRFARNGNLDTRRLAEAMQNINTIYTQHITVKRNVENYNTKFAFVIMIDESGSMRTKDRYDIFAVKTAILFYEALSKFKDIEIYVYGHGDRINKYITKENKNKFVLGNYDNQCTQNDYYSYNYIINDVRRQTNLPIVILNITDFYYCSSDQSMRDFFNDLRKNNVSFNMLTVGLHYSPREINMCKEILEGNVINISNVKNQNMIGDVYNELAQMIRKNYEKYKK